MRQKITVVGAGNVGATCAQELARRDYADVVLVDIIENFPQGKALDMNQAGSVLGYEPRIVGSNGYEETEGSDVVVITAGKPRSPGMSRDDLVTTNETIVGSVTREVVKRSPETVNREIATGEVEIRVGKASQLGDAETPPFEIESYSGEVGEELRLRYRYLDMRRPPMQQALAVRAEVVRAMGAWACPPTCCWPAR